MRNRILMIDDDEEMCEEMADILQDCGYDVTIALDGYQGLELIKNTSYDLVILDMKMPGLSGLDVLNGIKKTIPQTKVLVVTGRPLSGRFLQQEKTVGCFNNTDVIKLADGTINKPFAVDHVLERINELLNP